MIYHQTKLQDIAKELKTDLSQGLTDVEVEKRIKSFGLNKIPFKKPDTYFLIFIRQFINPLIYILIAAATIIYFAGHHRDAFFISFVLLLNAIVGTYQEGKSENILASLQKFMHTYSVVIRNGKRKIIDSENIVPGDIIILQKGDQVPADCRIISTNGLEINEASLTGESKPVLKITEEIKSNQIIPIFLQKNMLFSGTYVDRGSATALVVSTGINTEIGKLHKIVSQIDTDMPLKIEIEHVAYIILLIVLGICSSLFFIGFLFGREIKDLLTTITALFICAVPEGLPVIFTLILSLGVARMANKRVLIKRLQAIEGLGQTNILLIDKTGTLTKEENIVQKIFLNNNEIDIQKSQEDNSDIILMSKLASILSSAEIENSNNNDFAQKTKGDFTEVALSKFALKFNWDKENLVAGKNFYETPFSYESKIKIILIDSIDLISTNQDEAILLASGAPEVLIDQAKYIFNEKNIYNPQVINKKQTKEEVNKLVDNGLRIIGTGYKIIKKSEKSKIIEKLNSQKITAETYKNIVSDLILIGFFGLEDSIRENVEEVVVYAKESGIKIIMITGDHENSAINIAKQCKIYSDGDLMLSGKEVDNLISQSKSNNQILDRVTVFSRVTPEDKLKIVELYQSEKNIVAMTGDGVNDAPSLAASDIGIAMGKIGTEVAKVAADVILLDDKFETIIEALEEGRHIFYTLKRVVLYFFSTNTAEILIISIAMILNLKLPLNAIQILWINLITDGFLNMAIALEPRERKVLKSLSISKTTKLIDSNLIKRMLFMAIPMALGSIAIFYFSNEANYSKAQTLTLLAMILFQMFNAWNCRSHSKSIFELDFSNNKILLAVCALIIFFQILITNNNWLQNLFSTTSLTAKEWLLCIVVSSSIIFFEEIRKLIVKKKGW